MALLFLTIHYLILALQFALLIYALLSWLPDAQNSGLGRLLNRIVSPIIEPIDRIVPKIGMISFSVLIALILLQLADFALMQLAQRFML